MSPLLAWLLPLVVGILLFIIQCESIQIRKNSLDLTDDEKDAILDALYLMKQTPSIYDPSYNAYDTVMQNGLFYHGIVYSYTYLKKKCVEYQMIHPLYCHIGM